MEIAFSRSPRDLLLARKAYHARYKKSLEEDVAYHTTEAKILHERISEKAYSHEDLIRILATRSKVQINATLNHYKNEYGKYINKDLKADPKNEFLSILRGTVLDPRITSRRSFGL